MRGDRESCVVVRNSWKRIKKILGWFIDESRITNHETREN